MQELGKKRPVRLSKKWIVIGVMTVILVIGGVYGAMSVQYWQVMGARNNEAAQRLAADKATLFKETTSSTDRQKILSRLSGSSWMIGCSTGWWNDLQSSAFSELGKTKASCQAHRAKQSVVRRHAEKILHLSEDIATLQAALSRLKLEKTPITEDDIENHAKMAATIAGGLKSTSSYGVSGPVFEEARTVTGEISKAWHDLQEANKAQKRDMYDTAVNRLDQAYLKLAGVSKQATALYASLLSDLRAEM